jgi:hypothetical protein
MQMCFLAVLAPPPPPPDSVPCFNFGDDCSDYESPLNPCNTFTCASLFHFLPSSPGACTLISKLIGPLASHNGKSKHLSYPCVQDSSSLRALLSRAFKIFPHEIALSVSDAWVHMQLRPRKAPMHPYATEDGHHLRTGR